MRKEKRYFYQKFYITCVFSLLLIIFTGFAFSLAQTVNITDRKSYKKTLNDILEKQTQLKEEIKAIEATSDKDAKRTAQTKTSLSEKKLGILQQIDLIYEQQLLQVKQSLDINQTIEQLQNELADLAIQGISKEPPYSFLFLDELKEELIILKNQNGAYSQTVKTAEESLQAAKDKLETIEKNYRSIKEELEKKDIDPLTSSDLTLTKLSARLAREEVNLRNYILTNENLDAKIYQLKLELLQNKISLIQPLVQFSDKELQDQIVKIEKDEIKLKNNLEKVKTKEELTHSRWLNAKKGLSENLSPGKTEEKEREALNWKTWNETHHLEIEILSQALKYTSEIKKIWQYRYDLFNQKKSINLVELREEIEQAKDQLEREKQLLIVRQKECLNDIVSLENQKDAANESSLPTWSLDERIKALKTQKKLLDDGLEKIQSTRREYQKLKIEVLRITDRTSLSDQLGNIWIIATHVWNYEITSIEEHPITVGKIILSLILLIVGVFFSNYLTDKMGKQLVMRFSLEQAAAFAIQRICHYLLLVLIVLFVLSLVRIPLTFFTVVGGALAIGVGFGSQNIVNNFLSGLILMVERPIKIGDVVEAENVLGTVEWLGARSTRIKTFDNLRLVVPNSTLLQNKFINWSLSDDIVRREIIVGVVYGSPVRKIETLLQQASTEHSLVEQFPKPVVLFENFGDNALIFSLLIWLRMSRTGRAHLYLRQVESDIRFRIDELFRENDIVIAFPQRDVHLDTVKPLEVTLK
jgi:small-conductance mechanosensitive channel